MRRALIIIGIGATLASVALRADDHTILADRDVNFASYKTFSLHAGAIASPRSELNNPIVIKNLTSAIRTVLLAKGLSEAPGASDLQVEYHVVSIDYSISPWGVVRQMPTRGRGADRGDLKPAAFTNATLVIDMMHGDPASLVWRGVFNEVEKTAAQLAAELPKNATSLLVSFPPKKR